MKWGGALQCLMCARVQNEGRAHTQEARGRTMSPSPRQTHRRPPSHPRRSSVNVPPGREAPASTPPHPQPPGQPMLTGALRPDQRPPGSAADLGTPGIVPREGRGLEHLLTARSPQSPRRGGGGPEQEAWWHLLDFAEDDVHVRDGHIPPVDDLAVLTQL